MAEFMEIQRRLWQEQMQLLGKSPLGLWLLGGRVPATLEEFRAAVPLTTYPDYAAYFGEQREDILPVKPRWWLRTSGRSGEFGGYKWVPYTPDMARKLGETVLALFILAAGQGRNSFPFKEGDKLLYTMAPFPYMSGGVSRALLEEFPFTYLPPLEKAEAMEYQQRIQGGLQQALRDGLVQINAIAVVLVRIAEQFSQGTGSRRGGGLPTDPRVLARLVRGLIRARLAGRKSLLPKDLWDVKGIATGGTDTVLFREQVLEMWGREPIEAYGCTEAGVFALEVASNHGLVCLPDLDLLEFLPLEDHLRSRVDPSYHPRTRLLDEVEVGAVYEAVVTNFHGGVYTRYQTGDLLRVIALRDPDRGIDLPSMVFHSKSTDLIDLASFARLTEQTIWKAIEDAGVPYVDWTARKEVAERKPQLCLYIEPKGEELDVATVADRIHQRLAALDGPYADLEQMMGIHPLRVVLLPAGTFQRYYQARQSAGADMAHLKPPHMNAPEADMALLTGS